MSQNVNVNLVPGNYPKEFHVSQYDVGRQLVANIVDSTGAYSIPSGATVTLVGTKPSGFGFTLSGTVGSGGVVTFSTTATATAEYGRILCEIRITSGDTVLGTANLMLIVEESPHQEGVIDGNSETVIPELTILVERVEAAASNVLDMQVEADTLPAGSSATYSYDEETNTATFGIPQGEAGAGATGVVAPAYSASSTYAVGDYVIHNSNLYRCTTAITTAEAFTAAHWTQVLLGNDVSDLKSDIQQDGINNRVEIGEIENSIFTTNAYVPPFYSGGIMPDGTPVPSTIRIGSEFTPILPTRRFRIYGNGNIKFKIFYYGSDVATSFTKADAGWCYGSKVVLNDSQSTFYIRILVGYVDDRNVSSVSDLAAMITMNRLTPIALVDEPYIDNLFYQTIFQTANLSIGYYWNVEGSTAVKTLLETSNWMASDPMSVSEGEVYTVTGDQGTTHKTRIWILTDDSFNIIAKADDHYTTTEALATETVTVPSGATKLLLCTRYDAGYPYAWVYKKQSPFDLIEKVEKPLKGCRLSLLGDSISAYIGTIPTGYDAYYTGSNSGVTSSNQMWWKVLCDSLGMTPLVINGYSGSGVTQLEDTDHISKIPMSSDERCSGLHDGTINPDVIIIAGGVNDYTYALSAQSEPLEWNGKTVPVLSDSFTEAYACMVKKLQTNYPNAIIVCLSTWFTMRGTDNGYVLTHTVGSNTYSQTDYNNAIKYVAEQMHVPYMDVSNIGFNRNNFYPTYAIDSSTIPTHPNAEGQRVMGEAIANKLPELVKGYLK